MLPANGSPVEVFGIRHHGPGSARSLVAALADYQPDAVLIEGPADADPLLRWVLADGMTPPLALLGYAPDRPQTAAFWPYAVFSPEWQAMIYALQRDIEVGLLRPSGSRGARPVAARASHEMTMILYSRTMCQPRPSRRPSARAA